MPDLAVLTELADFYAVDIREILDGGRKSESMDRDTKETLLKVAEYTDAEKNKLRKKHRIIAIIAFLLILFFCLFQDTNGFGLLEGAPLENAKEFILGAITGLMGINLLCLYGFFEKAEKYKNKLLKRKGKGE